MSYQERYSNASPTNPQQPATRGKLSNLNRSQFLYSLLGKLTWPQQPESFLNSIHPVLSLESVVGKVTNVSRQNDRSVTIQLRTNRHWRGFSAGQFVAVTVEINGRLHSRCYSPTNAEHCPNTLEFTIARHDRGKVSQHLYAHARSGLVLRLSQASGTFHLPAERPESISLISGGSGITPMMSILRTLIEEKFSGDIHFLHYARNKEDALYLDELERINRSHSNVRVNHVFTRDESSPEQPRHFSREQLCSYIPDYFEHPTFLCGPERLMQGVRQVWEADDLLDQLFEESFSSKSSTPRSFSAVTEKSEIRLAYSERLLVNNGESLLEQVEAAGMQPSHGCRMGICHTCTCRKLSGQVQNRITGEISDGDDEDIRLCVSVPISTVTLDI